MRTHYSQPNTTGAFKLLILMLILLGLSSSIAAQTPPPPLPPNCVPNGEEEQNMRTLRNQQDRKDSFPVSPKTKPESNSDYLTPSEQKQK